MLAGTMPVKLRSHSGQILLPGTQVRQIGCPHGTRICGSVKTSMHLKHCKWPSVELMHVSRLLTRVPTDFSLSCAILIYSWIALIPPNWSLIRSCVVLKNFIFFEISSVSPCDLIISCLWHSISDLSFSICSTYWSIRFLFSFMSLSLSSLAWRADCSLAIASFFSLRMRDNCSERSDF